MILASVHLDTKPFVCVVAGGYVLGMLDLSIKYVEGMFFHFVVSGFTEVAKLVVAATPSTKDTLKEINQTTLSYGYQSRTSEVCLSGYDH